MNGIELSFLAAGSVGLALLLWSSVSWGMPESLNIYDQQRINRRWSWIIVGAFALFVGFLGFGVDVVFLRMRVPWLGLNMPDLTRQYAYGTRAYWDAVEAANLPGIPYAMLAAVGGSMLMAWFSFRNAAQMVLAASRARLPDPKDPKEAQFVNVAREMATAAGLPMPSVYIVPDADLNAFATGIDPEHAHVAVTEGLLKALDREELQGVISHELSHIRNADMELMTMVVALAGAAALLSDWSRRGMRVSGSGGSGGSRGNRKGAAYMFVIWLVFMILAPLISRLMALAVSRRREYLADASGAELTRNPLSLSRALEKIHGAAAPTESMSANGFGHLCIDDPRGSAFNGWEGFLGDLLASHPPIDKRIAALREMAYLKRPPTDGNLL